MKQINKKYYREYKELIIKQNNKCSICKKDNLKIDEELLIDEDIKINKIRGLLCRACIKALRLFNDNPELIKEAYLYISGKKLK